MKNLSFPTVHIGGSSIFNGFYLQVGRHKCVDAKFLLVQNSFFFILSFECLIFCPLVLNDKYISIWKRNSLENLFHKKALEKQFLYQGEIPLSNIQQAASLHRSFLHLYYGYFSYFCSSANQLDRLILFWESVLVTGVCSPRTICSPRFPSHTPQQNYAYSQFLLLGKKLL